MPPIHTTPRGIRQAVKQFKLEYPQHAQHYSAELQYARRLVTQQVIHRDDALGFLVGTPNRSKCSQVANHHCACGKPVCGHRIAVCLAVMAEELDAIAEHVARNEDALEANEVHELLAESEAST